MHDTITSLPTGWQRMPTARLYRLLEDLDDSTQAYEDLMNEIDARDRQADADRGAMNGWAPSR